MTKLRNIHPVDELVDVKAQIASLEARRDELRNLIITGTCGPRGDQHFALVKKSVMKWLDDAGLRKAWGDKALAPWLKTSRYHRVIVRRIKRKADQ